MPGAGNWATPGATYTQAELSTNTIATQTDELPIYINHSNPQMTSLNIIGDDVSAMREVVGQHMHIKVVGENCCSLFELLKRDLPKL